ncbi:hypothetical protein AMTR_s00003p00246440 [Amborella trichopoda]|uniref:Uncharacterized protein n=1 Tax=Amborella trichopoda TaxID=13333 RepID=W1P6R1_AMBTC|nr:hypothetical protein AMTR_s00003p00246440 [Amborella trichopoda]
MEKENMGLGAELVLVGIGLWALSLRPSLKRLAAEMLVAIGDAFTRMSRESPPSAFVMLHPFSGTPFLRH